MKPMKGLGSVEKKKKKQHYCHTKYSDRVDIYIYIYRVKIVSGKELAK